RTAFPCPSPIPKKTRGLRVPSSRSTIAPPPLRSTVIASARGPATLDAKALLHKCHVLGFGGRICSGIVYHSGRADPRKAGVCGRIRPGAIRSGRTAGGQISILTGGQKMNIKSLLLGSAATLVAATGAKAADAIVVAESEPVNYVRVCDAYGAGFFYIPGTET